MEPVKVSAATKSKTSTPLAEHGRLSVKGAGLVDKNGEKYILRGVSTHGLAWFPGYVNKAAFKTLRDKWGVSCIRLAMYTAEYGGYCSGGDKKALKKLIDDGVRYATALGMYVIVDWHILSDANPLTNKEEAKKFFDEISAEYADHDNVLYEICNEPNGGTSWADIKKYAGEVIPVIRKNAPDSIIIVGTPTWSQEVDKPASDPIKGYDNIMYTIHFYAGTHKESLRKRMEDAVKSGIPIFCTEFGTCDASGSGGNDFTEANKWIKSMEKLNISYCIWNLSNKSETSALINTGCSKTSGWKKADLSEAGKWYKKKLAKLGAKDTDRKESGTGSSGSSGNKADSGKNNGEKTGTTDSNSGSTGNSADKADSGKKNEGKSETGDAGTAKTGSENDVQNNSVTASLDSSNSWNDGTGYFHQYIVTIKNTGKSAISTWKVSLKFKVDVEVNQSWNGTVSAKGKTVTLKPADYNKALAPGETAEVGIIVQSAMELKDPVVTVK
ncbi:MAG: cellulase family glycosylhydrolase [Lachnospiraceae bacterium]|nr:cellulase family glycosylhydrolase [Lachnospiraceae bacterium]